MSSPIQIQVTSTIQITSTIQCQKCNPPCNFNSKAEKTKHERLVHQERVPCTFADMKSHVFSRGEGEKNFYCLFGCNPPFIHQNPIMMQRHTKTHVFCDPRHVSMSEGVSNIEEIDGHQIQVLGEQYRYFINEQLLVCKPCEVSIQPTGALTHLQKTHNVKLAPEDYSILSGLLLKNPWDNDVRKAFQVSL